MELTNSKAPGHTFLVADSQQACCAHTKVILKFHEYDDGTRSDYWECADGCGTKFVVDRVDKSFTINSLPKRVVIDAKGNYWRDFGTHFSMCPVSEDNNTIDVVAEFVLKQPSQPCRGRCGEPMCNLDLGGHLLANSLHPLSDSKVSTDDVVGFESHDKDVAVSKLDELETLLKMKNETANIFMKQVRRLQSELESKQQEYKQIKEAVIKLLETK